MDAAHLLAHFEECPACRERCEEAGKLRETLEDLPARGPLPGGARPAPRPAPRHASESRSRRRRSFPRSVTIVFAAGCGIAVGWAAVRFRTPAVPGRSRSRARSSGWRESSCACAARWAAAFPVRGSTERLIGRSSSRRTEGSSSCALESPASARLEADGPPRRHVAVMARLDDSSGLADVVDVLPERARRLLRLPSLGPGPSRARPSGRRRSLDA